MEVTFVVEEAGCASCAARVRAALEPVATVGSVEVDEAANEAVVRLSGAPSEAAVAEALAAASEGSGHAYRVRPGSWIGS